MAGTPNSILLLPADAKITVKEALAGGAITPGHLLERTTTATVVVHNSADVISQKMFALENLPIAGTISDAYASGDTVRFGYPQSGDEIYAMLPASAAAVVIGDALASNGDGTLKKAAVSPLDQVIVGFAIEAVDNSGGGTVVRIKIEVA